MKTRVSYFILFAVCLSFFTCKKSKNNGGGGEGEGSAGSVGQVLSVLDNGADKFYALLEERPGDPGMAMARTWEWLQTQNDVEKAVLNDDSAYIYIKTKGGLETVLRMELMDGNNKPMWRGGGGKTTGLQVLGSGSGSCSHPMENRKVLFWAAEGTKNLPNEQGFYEEGELAAKAKLITDYNPDIKVTIMENKACTPQSIEQFGDYGMVIMDTHGFEIGFACGQRLYIPDVPKDTAELKKQIKEQLGPDTYEEVLKSRIWIALTVYVDGKNGTVWQTPDEGYYHVILHSSFLEQHLPTLQKTIVMGNMCYSGAQIISKDFPGTPIRTVMLSRNPIAYYGYAFSTGRSRKVSDSFAKSMETVMIKRLFLDRDSTGIANLKADNTTEYNDFLSTPKIPYLLMKRFGADNYCYACGADFTDDRDGEVYKTVCIGAQTWMAENLRYNAPGSEVYDGNISNAKTLGRLYSVAQIMDGAAFSDKNPSGVKGICPKGWHVPSGTEFNVMLTSLGGATDAGAKLKSTLAWATPANATGESGFNALPAGSYSATNGYVGAGTQTFFRSTSGNASGVTTLYLQDFTKAALPSNYSQYDAGGVNPFMTSCRCVQDK